jgi:hypothetical protein
MQCRHALRMAEQSLTHTPLLRVVHQIHQRVRLRPHTRRWTREQRERVAAALRHTPGVHSFRISSGGHSVTIHHSAPVRTLIGSVQVAVARADIETAAPAPRAEPQVRPAKRKRNAARRLLLCAVVSLAIALLPQPVAPAMIVLRLLACGVAAAVRYQAEAHAEPCALTRLLDALASLVGLARAEHLVRAILRHCVEAVLKRWAEARLRRLFTGVPQPAQA